MVRSWMRALALSGAFATSALAQPAPAPAPPSAAPAPAALTPETLAVFAHLPSDPPPPALTRNSHYWVSNEYRLELFHDGVKDRGGIFVGVGTDQCYLLAAWARSEIMVPMDFDGAIADLHRAYAVAFAHADDPTAFIELWSPAQAKQMEGWLKETYTDADRQKAVLKAFKYGGPVVYRRLKQTRKSMQKLNLPTFMDDAEQYRYLKNLWAQGRVFPVRGDLTADQTMKAIGDAARSIGMPVRLLYVSNAEQYFDFNEGYRRNVIGLPMDDRSVVVRTLGWGVYGMADATYHYNLQPGLNFQAWLGYPKVKNAGKMLAYRTPSTMFGFSTMEKTPADFPMKPTPAARPAKPKEATP